MKNKKVFILSLLIIAGFGALFFILFFSGSRQIKFPEIFVNIQKGSGAAKAVKAQPGTQIITRELEKRSEEGGMSAKAAPAEGAQKKAEQKEEAVSLIKVKPEEVTVKVIQGMRKEAGLEVFNEGKKDTFLNIYKSEPDISEEESTKRLEELKAYRKNIIAGKPSQENLIKAELFSGAPWLITFPCYVTIKPGEKAPVKLTVDARELEDKDYKVDLFIIGADKKEALVVPVAIEVAKGAEIKLIQIMINDGFTTDTTGNRNHLATAGEMVLCSLNFKNKGSGFAKGLTVKLAPSESSLQILSNRLSYIPYVAAGEEFQVSFIAKVLVNSSSTIPPVMKTSITDDQGMSFQEEFYLGDPDKIAYPMGAKVDKKEGL